MEITPIRLVTQDELRAGAKRILARRRRALVASLGGFVAAGLATFIVPAGVMFFGFLWLSATLVTGLMVWDAECPRCHSPFHITLLRRDWRTCQCLHCGFDVRQPEEQRPGPTTNRASLAIATKTLRVEQRGKLYRPRFFRLPPRACLQSPPGAAGRISSPEE